MTKEKVSLTFKPSSGQIFSTQGENSKIIPRFSTPVCEEETVRKWGKNVSTSCCTDKNKQQHKQTVDNFDKNVTYFIGQVILENRAAG